MNIPACCNGIYTRRGFILSYYDYSPVSPPSAGFTNTDTALDIPYISIRVIIAFERASRKPQRSSYLPANYCEAFASHMLLPSHIPIRIFHIDNFICEKLRVNWWQIYTLQQLPVFKAVYIDISMLDTNLISISVPTIFWRYENCV